LPQNIDIGSVQCQDQPKNRMSYRTSTDAPQFVIDPILGGLAKLGVQR